jgi:long-chain fatty acid transport protein
MKINQKLITFALVILLANISNSFAAGYSTNSTSTSGFGNSYAGSVTGIHDISDIFFNPSVTTDLKSSQFIASVSYLRLTIDPDKVGGKFSGGSNISGNDASASTNNFIPAFYLATPINKKATFNLAITSPFGLATKYDGQWAGRYRAVESSISTLNINPSFAYKLSDKFSIGAGIMAQYYQASLTKSVYTGGNDAVGKLNGSDWGYGYNLGLSYKFNDKLKFGVGYRSKIDYKLSGNTRVSDLGLYSDFTAKTSTPESLTVGTAYKLNKAIELAYDTTWTRWSRLKSLVVNAHQNSNLNDTATFNWHDSFLHSIGANFTVSEKTLIRTGLAYEKDAITNANREPRIPSGDRIWTSLGFNYKFSKDWAVDGAYVHQFFRATKMNIADSTATVNSLQAKYKNRVDVLSVAIKKDF